MNLQQLRIIRETVRHQFNLTDTAQALLTSQSGVSKNIRDLEEELGLEIFVRRGKRFLGLTEPGKDVIAVAERILLEAENMMSLSEQFSRADTGTLHIATTHTQARYILPRSIAQFKADYPNVRLVLHQASPKELAAILLEGSTDLGIATDTLDDHPGLLTFPYIAWSHAVVVPQEHPLRQLSRLTLDAVAEYPIVTYDEGLTGRARIDAAFERAGLAPDIAMSALDADVIKAYVELGLGVGIIASIAFDAARDRGLAMLDSAELFAPSRSSIAIRRGRFLRSYVYRFIELCAPELTEQHIRSAARPILR